MGAPSCSSHRMISMSGGVYLAEIPWPEFAHRVAGGEIVFIPLGATEQHGQHLPLGVDAILASAICESLARRVGGMVVPVLAYGNRSQPRTGGGPAFPGTINVAAETFSLLLRDVIADLYRHGVRRMAVINGHFENI